MTDTPMSSESIDSRSNNRHSRAPYPVQKNANHGLLLTIQSLPHELLVIILQQSLPQLDWNADIPLSSDPCPEYVAALYSLRSICGAWRYLVDGTPSFWKVVCAALPMEANSTSIAKSGQSPLIVHCPDAAPDPVVEFMKLANSQRSRWATASFELYASHGGSVSSYLADPAPQLQSLSLEGDLLAEHIEIGISLFGGQTQNIRKLSIFGTPIQWSSNAFTGLKSLQLSEIRIHNGGPTIQHILDILACSPALETLELSRTKLVHTPIDTHSPKLSLPLLKILSLFSVSGIAVERILDRIAVDPEIVTRIDIYPLFGDPISNWTHFLTEILLPFAPVFRRLNKACDGSTLKILPRGGFLWRSNTKQGHSFRAWLRDIGLQASLPWLEQAVGTDGVGVLLRLDLFAFTGGDIEILSTFERSTIVTGVDVTLGFNSACRDAVLDAVSRIEEVADGQAGMVAIPSFPSLHTILLENWTGGLNGIEEALRKRFAKRAMMKARLPDLLVKISCLRVGERVANRSEGILHYDDTHRIRSMDGVRDFRIGDVSEDEEKYAGILAVVWYEASSRVVWG